MYRLRDYVYLTRAYTLASMSGFFHITHKYFTKMFLARRLLNYIQTIIMIVYLTRARIDR